MISFEEALTIVRTHPMHLETESVPLENCLFRILAHDVYTDLSLPPFNKSAVDGYACRFEDLNKPMSVTETISAGSLPEFAIGAGQCARIMTGAMVPDGADGVIMVEDTLTDPDGNVQFTGKGSNRNICLTGEDLKRGDLALSKGTFIQPPHIAVLASVGAVTPLVYCLPSVAVISTGDELIPPDKFPGRSEIRDSNSYQLISQLQRMRIPATNLGIIKDIKTAIRDKIQEGLSKFDLILLSGGVSMGDYDFVPEIMQDAGIEIFFQSIAIQPGKPTLFGQKGNKTVFGLPGNPVSSFVLFERLVKPFLFTSMGMSENQIIIKLPMGTAYSRKNSVRKSVFPVLIRDGEVFPVSYHGSAHIHAYTQADGMVEMEIGQDTLPKGYLADVRQL